MSLLPGPAQTVAICLSAFLPVLLFCYAQLLSIRGAGIRFRIGCLTVATLFALACFALPGQRQFDDVAGGIMLLATAMLLVYVFWSLLAWGFTLTLLTALSQACHPLNREEWAAAYMRGGDLDAFAHNRLKLLLGAGLLTAADGNIVTTRSGLAVVRLVRFVRLATGLGSAP